MSTTEPTEPMTLGTVTDRTREAFASRLPDKRPRYVLSSVNVCYVSHGPLEPGYVHIHAEVPTLAGNTFTDGSTVSRVDITTDARTDGTVDPLGAWTVAVWSGGRAHSTVAEDFGAALVYAYNLTRGVEH